MVIVYYVSGPENKVGTLITFHNRPNMGHFLIYPPYHPSICLSIHPLPQPSVSPSIHPPQPSIHPPTPNHPSIIYLPQPPIYPSTHHLFIHLSVQPSIHSSNHPPVYLSTHPPIHPIFQWSTSYWFSVTFYQSCHIIASLEVTLLCFITT